MTKIEYVVDPEDFVGPRCDDEKGQFKCHRRKGHSSNTRVTKKLDDDKEVVVEFNHRTMTFGGFYTW